MSFAKKQIYFIRPIQGVGLVKIGCSSWPSHRLQFLLGWSPVPLEIAASGPGDHTLERALHRLFDADRSHKEWFRSSQQLLAGIEAVASGADVPTAFGLKLSPTGRSWPKEAYIAARVAA